MCQPIMVACDLHDKSMLLKFAQGREVPQKLNVKNSPQGRMKMIDFLKEQAKLAGDARIIFAYEASGQGFGLYDELTDAGIECHVLAPTKIARSPQQQRQKTDEKDADLILELLRGHVLAGNRLPTVWVPDPETRDHRELVRARLDVADKSTALKLQINSLLKLNQLTRPDCVGKGWTKRFWKWLRWLCNDPTRGVGLRETLGSLLRQLEFIEKERERLEVEIAKLAELPRYAPVVAEVAKLQGVGLLTAMVYLTEIGDLRRFKNRRQLAAFLGLAPCAFESGSANDRKGHITRQGPSRVRRVLCQAVWTQVRTDGPEKAAYERIVEKNPKRKKIAVVASMRRLAVRIWHRGKEAQEKMACSSAAPAAQPAKGKRTRRT